MSFLSQTRLPVTEFKSTDANAPVLSGLEVKGEVKTLLKACLKTGYGTKTGMGWTIRDETDFGATFVSNHPLSTTNLTIDNSNADACVDFSIKTKVNNLALIDDKLSFIFEHIPTRVQNPKWALIATEASFLLIVEVYKSSTNNNYIPFFFGACSSKDASENVAIYTKNKNNSRKLGFNASPVTTDKYEGSKKKISGIDVSVINTAAGQMFNTAVSLCHPIYYLTDDKIVCLPFYAKATRGKQLNGFTVQDIDGRQMLSIVTGWDGNLTAPTTESLVIPLDYWSI